MAGTSKPMTGMPPTTGDETIEQLRDRIERIIGEAKTMADDCIAAGRDMTDPERERYEELMLRAEGLTSRLGKARRAADARSGRSFIAEDVLGGIFGSGGGTYTPEGSRAARGKAWGQAVVRANSDGPRWKGITPAGTVLVAIPAPEAVPQGRPVAQLRSLITTEPTDGYFNFLRHDLRDNNAAPVPPGGLKPTSQFLYTGVQDRARTIAHLSTPLHRSDVSDSQVLQELIAGEMYFGLEQALESQIIVGDGIGENLLGLQNTPGIQTCPRPSADDYGLIRGLRAGLTKLESLGLTGTGYVVNPVDWEAIETAALDDGSLAYNGGSAQSLPLDRSARRIWGIPVVSSPSCPIGVAYLADFAGSTKLWVREEARLDWSENVYMSDLLGPGVGSTLFETNQVIFRCEGRFGFGVTRPTGVVRISLVHVP